jgi:hypothetical protein
MKPLLFRVLAPVALCALASSPSASELTLNGETSIEIPPGLMVDIHLSGNPGLPAFLLVDFDPGPFSFQGEDIPIGFSPDFYVFPMGMTDAAGLASWTVQAPATMDWFGVPFYFAGVIVDPADPNGKDVANGVDLVGVPETCTPAVIAACIAAGLTACTSGSPDCGPPPADLCTPAIVAACEAAGFCACDSATGVCEGTPGAAGGCCDPSEMDDCGVCFGDGTGVIGCPGNCGGGTGTCVCDTCICPDPFFGAACTCTSLSALYNGLYQHSYIPDTDLTLMGSGRPRSFEAWIKPTQSGAPIITRMAASQAVWALSVGTVGDPGAPNTLRLYTGTLCANCELDGNAVIPLNQWTHVAFTWDDTTEEARFYVNGVFDGSGTFSPSPPSAGQTLIGLFGSAFYGGQIDDMRMWSTVRTPAEILDNLGQSLLGDGEPTLVFNHNMQKWTTGDVETVDYSDNHLNLFHSLFVSSTANFEPAPDVEQLQSCPASNCNGAGSCSCGVCACFIGTDTTYDCSG